MGRDERKRIIQEIENHRGSKVLVYFVGDRPLLKAQIASDSIRWIYDHLKEFNKNEPVEKIDFYLYSRGGSLETPWPIVSIMREYCKNFNVLITSKAFSATTLISLGADKIFMSPQGELGPVDPQMTEQGKGPPGTSPIQRIFSTEDISSYVSFIKDKVGITDQDALADLTKSLADTLTPTTLGQVNRVHSHIRTVARKMLSLIKPAISPTRIQEIIEALTERTYIHGHSIRRDEARSMGLQINNMDTKLEKLCWDLFLDYENEMNLNSPANPLAYFSNPDQEEYVEDNAVIASIESEAMCHQFVGPLVLKKVRQMPPQLNLNLNIPIQLPPGILSAQLTPQLQQLLQQLQQQFAAQISTMTTNQINRMSPVIGVDVHIEKTVWKLIS
ncbi:MAG: hypothetical protein K8Q89_02085 [Nitrosarchaeum sp.]|nr:hypothetical protein [Nitrosarchaeum sp.]